MRSAPDTVSAAARRTGRVGRGGTRHFRLPYEVYTPAAPFTGFHLPAVQCRPTERDSDCRTDEVSVRQLLSGSDVPIVPQNLELQRVVAQVV